MFRSHRRAGALCLSLALVTAACGEDDQADGGGDGLELAGAWARTSAQGQSAGAVYLTITSDEDDALVAASVPAEVARRVELHETVTVDDGADSDDAAGREEDSTSEAGMASEDGMAGMGGAMTMRPVEQVVLPAGEAVSLEPGGLHVMLLDLPDPLQQGETFTLTLTMQDGQERPVEVEVRDQAP